MPNTQEIRIIQNSFNREIIKSSPAALVLPYIDNPFLGESISKKSLPLPSNT